MCVGGGGCAVVSLIIIFTFDFLTYSNLIHDLKKVEGGKGSNSIIIQFFI